MGPGKTHISEQSKRLKVRARASLGSKFLHEGVVPAKATASGWAQNEVGDAVGANAQAGDLLDLRGDLPNPRRIGASELHKLPRAELRTTDPHDSSKEIIYSGVPLVEVLKAGGLLLNSGLAGMRDAVTVTVLVEAADGYRAVFSLAELEPELTDRMIVLADTKDGQPLPAREGPFRVIVPARNALHAGCAKSTH